MYAGKTLFAQIMDFPPWKTFHHLVSRHEGNRGVRTLSCAEQFRVLAFAQLTGRESLRDIEASLSAQSAKLCHMGIRSPVRRSTLADANERRDWRIHAEFAQRLIAQARALHAGEDLGLELDNTVYALDSSTIDLCLSVFPWGPVPLREVRRQAAHASGPARQHSGVHPRFRGQAARRQRAGSAGSGTRRLPCHGPRPHRLRALVPPAQPGRLLRRPGEVQHQVPPPALPARRQARRRPVRPDHRPDGREDERGLPPSPCGA